MLDGRRVGRQTEPKGGEKSGSWPGHGRAVPEDGTDFENGGDGSGAFGTRVADGKTRGLQRTPEGYFDRKTGLWRKLHKTEIGICQLLTDFIT